MPGRSFHRPDQLSVVSRSSLLFVLACIAPFLAPAGDPSHCRASMLAVQYSGTRCYPTTAPLQSNLHRFILVPRSCEQRYLVGGVETEAHAQNRSCFAHRLPSRICCIASWCCVKTFRENSAGEGDRWRGRRAVLLLFGVGV